MKSEINSFFKNMKTILKSESTCDEHHEKNEQRTNVIYLNTNCNLRCEYCYEENSRSGLSDQSDCTIEMIDNFLKEIYTREKDCVSTIVIMGGEPFLKFDLIHYTVLKCIDLVQNKKHKGWGISLITNATLFTNSRLEILKNLIDSGEKNSVKLSLEVSYDASGHFKRKFPNGNSSKEIVEESIFKLIDFKIPFKISYVAHSGNYKNVVKDCIYIILKFKSKYLKRIIVGYAYKELDECLSSKNGGVWLKKKIIPWANELFKLYNIPICDHTCGLCKQCDKGNFIGNSYLSPTTGITYDKKRTEHSFQQF